MRTAVAPSASQAAPSAPSALSAAPETGRWIGAYDAKKGNVEIPKGVSYDAWNDDDGKRRAGKGSIELDVAGDGEVTGSARGALGEQQLRGRIVEGFLEVGVTPVDPDSENAMRGVLTGEMKADRITAELRAASGDARIVRQASVTLRRP